MALRGRSAKPFNDETALYEHAVASLARRMRTVAEIERLLRDRVAPGPAAAALVEAVLGRLRERGYVSDASYAAAYAASRQAQRKLGRRRVERDLRARGVPAEVVDREVAAAFAGVDEAAQARAYLLRRRVPPPGDQRAAARVLRMLVRAGFAPGVVLPLIREWRARPRGQDFESAGGTPGVAGAAEEDPPAEDGEG